MDKIDKWVKLRNKASVEEQLQTEGERDGNELAEEIFKVWDKRLLRYIMFEDFAENMIALGLAPDSNTVRKMMVALKGENANFPDQLTVKEFKRLFDLNRFASKAGQKICEEFKEEKANFAHQQFVKIIGGQVQAGLKKASNATSKSPSKNKKKV